MANTVYDNFYLSNEVEDQFNSHLDLQQFCTVDKSLEGQAGMKRVINVYTATDGTEKLAQGVGNSKSISVSHASKEYEILLAQNRFEYYDEEAMRDPMIVPVGMKHAGTDLFNTANADIYAEYEKATLSTAPTAFDFVAFRWLKGSSAVSIFVAIVSLYLIRVVVSALNMKLIEAILNMVLDVGVLAVIVIFQPEIRKFLSRLGNRYMSNPQGRAIVDRILGRKTSDEVYREEANNIAEACFRMAESKTGALIVITHNTMIDEVINTGDRINANVHRRLLQNLFFKNSPLHDGAVIISRDKIVAARCTLPITERRDIPANFGMRHKAAIGITEDTDAYAVVVSEETGKISFVSRGNVTPVTNINELKQKLTASTGK